MNIIVFDTETISINKPFCYNVGYVVLDENWEVLTKKDFIIEQVWHNRPLFETAYYADKRPLYISKMKGRKAKMAKWYQVARQIKKDIENYEVQIGFAFNSQFDEKVMEFNADYFHFCNPFDVIPILDIRGFWHHFILNYNTSYFDWCEEHEAFTESKNYSSTAETVFRYTSGNETFEEEHTALADSEIEANILQYVMEHSDMKIDVDYKAVNSLKREVIKELEIYKDKDKIMTIPYINMRMNKDKTVLKLK